ncbi:MAG: redoxin domain-containing protein, partial [Armatimonadetes bacterium]|nr:redoxin domain-containing protein [Armatimonadota bacterium]
GIAVAFAAIAAMAPAGAQQTDTVRVLMRLGATYRACRSVRAEGTWTRKIADKETTASIALAAQRPNLYRLEIQGADISCDGKSLTALRTDRKAYTRTEAPAQLIGHDLLKGIDIPTPGVLLKTLLLQGMWRDAKHPLAQRLCRAELTGPQPYGDRQAYVLKFDYNADYTARAYVTADDYVLRRVALYAGDRPEIVETYTRVEFDKPMEQSGFAIELPEGARQVAMFPPVVLQQAPTPITVTTMDDRRIAFADLRGKTVIVTFFFTTCPYCNDEMPHLEQLYQRFKDKGLEVIALNGTGETKEALKQWAQTQGVTFPVAMNKTTTDLVSMFKVKAYPTNVIFGPEGRVIYKKEGLDLAGMAKALAEAGFRPN